MNKFVIQSCFDEEKTAYDILVLKRERRQTLKRHIENKNCPQYYILITKYLLNHNYSIHNIKEIIRKHIALVAYMIIREKKPGKYIEENIYLNKLLYGKEMSIDSYFLDDDSIEYFNGAYDVSFELFHNNDFEITKSMISKMNDLYEKITGNNNLFTLLNIIMDYFYFGCQFADLKYINHSDIMIPHIQNSEKLSSFQFEVIDGPFDEYYVSKQPFKWEDVKEKILGHIINIIFLNNNLNFEKEMKIMPMYYYELMFNQERKKYIKDTYSFFDVDAINQIATINSEKINESFNFMYNNECYTFTKEGIVKI